MPKYQPPVCRPPPRRLTAGRVSSLVVGARPSSAGPSFPRTSASADPQPPWPPPFLERLDQRVASKPCTARSSGARLPRTVLTTASARGFRAGFEARAVNRQQGPGRPPAATDPLEIRQPPAAASAAGLVENRCPAALPVLSQMAFSTAETAGRFLLLCPRPP